MLDTFHWCLRSIHIGIGIAGLLLFWGAALSRKGGPMHRRLGSLFVSATYVIVVTALISCAWNLIDPESFSGRSELNEFTRRSLRFSAVLLAGLAMLTSSAAVMGIRCARYRVGSGHLLDTKMRLMYFFLATCGFGMIAVGIFDGVATSWSPRNWVLVGLGLASVLVAVGDYAFAKAPPQESREILGKHIGSMIGCGIAYHTAFMIAGAHRILGEFLVGPLELLPWVLPTAIGWPAAAWLIKKHTVVRKLDRSA